MKKEQIKKWKPGQLVTISNKVYRVKKAKNLGSCDYCVFRSIMLNKHPCNTICVKYNKMQNYCYLEEL